MSINWPSERLLRNAIGITALPFLASLAFEGGWASILRPLSGGLLTVLTVLLLVHKAAPQGAPATAPTKVMRVSIMFVAVVALSTAVIVGAILLTARFG